MKTTTIYETGNSDGYTHFPDGKFYTDSTLAAVAGRQRHGNYAIDPIEHDAIEDEEGRFYLLKSPVPVAIEGTEQAIQNLRKNALAKLTPEERKVLQLET